MNRKNKPPAIDWRDVIAISADWYWEQDAELRFTYFTSPELAAAGMSDADYVGKRRWETPHHGVSDAQWAEHRAALERRAPFRDFVVGRYRDDGGASFVSISGRPHFDERGRFLGYRGISRDVTEHRRAEERILAMNAELEARIRQRTQQLEEANRELESFSYSVSHDLRAPLRAIHGFSGLLERQTGAALDEKGRHYLGRIQEASARMGRLIDDLLELSRLTRAALRPESLDLSRLAAQVEGLGRGRAGPGGELLLHPS